MQRFLVVYVLLAGLRLSEAANNKTDDWRKERASMITGLSTLQKRLKMFKVGIEFQAFAEAHLTMATEIMMKTDPILAIIQRNMEGPEEINEKMKKCYKIVKRNVSDLSRFVYNYQMKNCSTAFVERMDEILREINDVYIKVEKVVVRLQEIEVRCAGSTDYASPEECAREQLKLVRESLSYMVFLSDSKRRDVRESTKDALAVAQFCFSDKRTTEILEAARPFINAAATYCINAAHKLPKQSLQ